MPQNIDIKKGLDVYALIKRETGMSQTQHIKTFSAKNECYDVNFGVLKQYRFRYSFVKFFLV